eukprot:967576-Alexandrium_andersonii.AAC.1
MSGGRRASDAESTSGVQEAAPTPRRLKILQAVANCCSQSLELCRLRAKWSNTSATTHKAAGKCREQFPA